MDRSNFKDSENVSHSLSFCFGLIDDIKDLLFYYLLLLARHWPFLYQRTHYPSGRTWANICCSSGYASLVCVSIVYLSLCVLHDAQVYIYKYRV